MPLENEKISRARKTLNVCLSRPEGVEGVFLDVAQESLFNLDQTPRIVISSNPSTIPSIHPNPPPSPEIQFNPLLYPPSQTSSKLLSRSIRTQ